MAADSKTALAGIQFKDKRAITFDEHQRIVAREKNPERRNFYWLCWHLGGSQTDVAYLSAEDIDWQNHTIAYARKKTGSLAIIHFGDEIAEVLRRLPQRGPLFPYIRKVRCGVRATEFKQRCVGLGIIGVSLHSYRYAWAERARVCGYPERFAQKLSATTARPSIAPMRNGHMSQLPSLEKYEKSARAENIIPINVQSEHAKAG